MCDHPALGLLRGTSRLGRGAYDTADRGWCGQGLPALDITAKADLAAGRGIQHHTQLLALQLMAWGAERVTPVAGGTDLARG